MYRNQKYPPILESLSRILVRKPPHPPWNQHRYTIILFLQNLKSYTCADLRGGAGVYAQVYEIGALK